MRTDALITMPIALSDDAGPGGAAKASAAVPPVVLHIRVPHAYVCVVYCVRDGREGTIDMERRRDRPASSPSQACVDAPLLQAFRPPMPEASS